MVLINPHKGDACPLYRLSEEVIIYPIRSSIYYDNALLKVNLNMVGLTISIRRHGVDTLKELIYK